MTESVGRPAARAAIDLDNGQISSIGDNLVAPVEQRLGHHPHESVGARADPQRARRRGTRVIDARAQMAAVERQVGDLAAQVATIATDQQRVRENMKALGRTREERALVERYTRELNAQEDRLAELQAQMARLSGERDARRAALAPLVQQRAFDITVR